MLPVFFFCGFAVWVRLQIGVRILITPPKNTHKEVLGIGVGGLVKEAADSNTICKAPKAFIQHLGFWVGGENRACYSPKP